LELHFDFASGLPGSCPGSRPGSTYVSARNFAGRPGCQGSYKQVARMERNITKELLLVGNGKDPGHPGQDFKPWWLRSVATSPKKLSLDLKADGTQAIITPVTVAQLCCPHNNPKHYRDSSIFGRPGWIRTTCEKCGRFIGNRPQES